MGRRLDACLENKRRYRNRPVGNSLSMTPPEAFVSCYPFASFRFLLCSGIIVSVSVFCVSVRVL